MHPNMIHKLVAPGRMVPIDIASQVHRQSLTPIRNTANLVWGWQMNILALQENARVMLTGQRGNATLSAVGAYEVGDFCTLDSQVQLLRRVARRAANSSAWRSLASRLVRAAKSSTGAAESVRWRAGIDHLSQSFRSENKAAMQYPANPPSGGTCSFGSSPNPTRSEGRTLWHNSASIGVIPGGLAMDGVHSDISPRCVPRRLP